jgi:hypothetical protein
MPLGPGPGTPRGPDSYPYATAENERICYIDNGIFLVERDGQFYHLIPLPYDEGYQGLVLYTIGEPLSAEELQKSQEQLDALKKHLDN